MTHEKTTEQPMDKDLWKASGYLAHALIVSHTELNARWMYEMDREDFEACIQEGEMFTDDGKNLKVQLFHTKKRLAEIQGNTAIYWDNALSHMNSPYKEKAVQVLRIMNFANKLVLESASPMGLLAEVHNPFSSAFLGKDEIPTFSSWETLPGIFLVRGYLALDSDDQKKLLEANRFVGLILGREEAEKMILELTKPFYRSSADDVTRDILTGRLQLPEVPEI